MGFSVDLVSLFLEARIDLIRRWLHYINNMQEMDIEQTNLNSQETIARKEFGNIIVLNQKYVHLSVGPHYKQFFLGFTLLLLYQLGLLALSFTMTEGILHKQIGAVLCLIAPTCYLTTALRDPGLYRASECHEPKTKYCHKCQHFMTTGIQHCNLCNTCIIGYDHHCRWLSKCVGRNNLWGFYAFIGSLTLLNAYMYYTFYCMFWAKP